ncbi:hypothetical protein SGFS_084580 [Streptomyces graminofaciens]|uniref:Secreted protein n=1 Tax=Streptomyces graminofaciens TaxID=68212 RepID=A0ABM7FKC3_9ACTN|nr:hypothetical protein SGFS_084580 [Streptomyces graminofaciens]
MAACEVMATAAAAAVVSTVTRVRLGCFGRRWDATEASSFFLQPPTDTPVGGAPPPSLPVKRSTERRFDA